MKARNQPSIPRPGKRIMKNGPAALALGFREHIGASGTKEQTSA